MWRNKKGYGANNWKFSGRNMCVGSASWSSNVS